MGIVPSGNIIKLGRGVLCYLISDRLHEFPVARGNGTKQGHVLKIELCCFLNDHGNLGGFTLQFSS
jgi:hypothetical protein